MESGDTKQINDNPFESLKLFVTVNGSLFLLVERSRKDPCYNPLVEYSRKNLYSQPHWFVVPVTVWSHVIGSHVDVHIDFIGSCVDVLC